MSYLKNILFICIYVFVFADNVFGQKLHLITIIDDSDSLSGSIQNYKIIQEIGTSINSASTLNVESYYFSTKKSNYTELLETFNTLKVSTGDAIWFYYSGKENNTNDKIPNFSFEGDTRMISQDDIHEIIQKKNARLYINMYDVIKTNAIAPIPINTTTEKNYSPYFYKLFTVAKGDIKITNVKNTADNTYGNKESGGILTISFAEALIEQKKGSIYNCTWNNMLKSVGSKTSIKTKNMGNTQNTYYICKVEQEKLPNIITYPKIPEYNPMNNKKDGQDKVETIDKVK